MLILILKTFMCSLLCIISHSAFANQNKISHDQTIVPMLQVVLPLNISEVEDLSYQEKLDLQCVAWNLYFEARGTSEKEQVAVAWVPINRTQYSRWSIDICENVFQYNFVNGRKAYQFVWAGYVIGPNYRVEYDTWISVQRIAYQVYKGNLSDPSNGATYFNHHSVGGRRGAIRIGHHVFYK